MSDASSQYHGEEYWNDLHSEHQGSLKAVGQRGLSISYNSLKYRSEADSFKKITSGISITPNTILELGVGTGFWTDQMFALWGKSIKVTGVDLSAVAISELCTRHPEINGIVGNLGVLPTDTFDRQFDCVTAVMVFLHITDETQFINALNLAARSVRGGGVLIVYEPFLSRRYSPFRASNYGAIHNKVRERRIFDNLLKLEGLDAIYEFSGSTWIINSPIEANLTLNFKLMNILWQFLSATIYKSNSLVKLSTSILLVVDKFCKRQSLSRSGNFVLYKKAQE